MNEEVYRSLFEHEAFIAIYGVLFWYGCLFVIHYRKARAKKIAMSGRTWLREMKFNIILTFGAIPWVLVWDDEIIAKFNSVSEYDLEPESQIIYALTGPIVEWLIRQILKLVK